MPNYEYECQNCHVHVELVQSIEKQKPPAMCPSCSMQHTMVRVLTLQGSSSEASSKKKDEE